MSDDVMHRVETIVTTGMQLPARRMRVPGGWLYWIEIAGTSPVSTFVPMAASEG